MVEITLNLGLIKGTLIEAPFELSYFELGVTSRDLTMPFSVFQKLWRKWALAQKLLGLEWCNLAKS